jgi:hypothetical protein
MALLPIEGTISLSVSSDGGFTYGNEMTRSLGKVGEYKRKIYWDRLGRARNRTFKVVISSPVKVVLVGCLIEIEEGTN